MISSNIKLNNINNIQQIGKRFYAKRLVSKRVYDQLKREKVVEAESHEIFKVLTEPPNNKPIDSLKPIISKALQGVEKYLGPNLSTQRSVAEELDKNTQINNDLMDLVERIKYHQPDLQTTDQGFEKLSKSKAPTAREVLKNLRTVYENNKNPVQQPTATSSKKSKTRFFYRAGPGSALYDFNIHQLKEINILEQKSIQTLKEKEEYAKLNKTKEDFSSEMNKLYQDKN